MFIAFEGLDGSGSSTHARLLAERLRATGKPVLLTKEPTSDTPTGRQIRDILRHKQAASPEALQRLFVEDRAAHLKDVIEPALARGEIVITDRYLFSTLAYGAPEVPMELLKSLNQNFRLPDITLFLRLDPRLCLERIRGRGQDFELFEKEAALKKVLANYEAISKDYPNFVTIDASGTIEETAKRIDKAIVF
ncbi:dTMP kinase [Candidatus Peregrinibacteria bacterium]|nr:dTMP kinase [Candidatus Peregrinibacteria bacterium]